MLSYADLTALEANIAASPKNNAPISQLCFRPTFGQRVFADHLELCPKRGVIGDRWAELGWLKRADGSPDPRVQIALINQRLLTAIWGGGTEPPHPADTIATDLDISQDNLPAGRRLRIGTALIEISDVPNDGCVKWKARYGSDAYIWAREEKYLHLRRRGAFARVIEAGTIKLSDTVTLA